MKLVNKLLLVSAIAASSQAFAMESMSEADMSQTTGQDGVTVTLNLVNGINAQAILHDTNGLTPNGTFGSAGAIVFGDGTTAGNFKISSGIITLDIDADGGTGVSGSTTGAVLNVKIGLPSNLTVTTGDISVAKSGGLGGTLTNSTKVFNSTTVSLGGLNVNMQLGAEAQGNMLKVSGAITNGISLSTFALLDGYNGSTAQTNVGIGATTVTIKDNGAANLTLGDIRGDVTAAAGLQFTLTSVGSATGVDVQMTGLKLGDQAGTSVGNFELRGLNMNGTILGVKGH
jgi:hypothetical protein